MRFDGKVALVSGAGSGSGSGSGIGRATALGFAARGAKVAVADIDGERAGAVAAEIAGAGGKALAITADAGAPAGIEAMVGGTVGAFGGLDILHNNAFGQPALPPGQSRLAFTGDIDETVWAHDRAGPDPNRDRSLQHVDPEGPVRLCREASARGLHPTNRRCPPPASAGPFLVVAMAGGREERGQRWNPGMRIARQSGALPAPHPSAS